MPPKAKAAPAPAIVETAVQRRVRLADLAGNRPFLSKSKESLFLTGADGRRITLEKRAVATPAGLAWHRRKGTHFAPKSFPALDMDQPPSWDKRRLSTYALTRDGRRRVITKYDPNTNQGKTTQFGRMYYERSTMRLAVTVPTRLRIKANGRMVENMWVSMESAVDSNDEVRVLRHQTDAERQQTLRQHLLDRGYTVQVNGEIRIFEDSQTLTLLDETRQFQISEIRPLANGVGLADLPAASGSPVEYGSIIGSVIPEAYENTTHGRCVIHQLKALTGIDEGALEAAAKNSYELRYGENRQKFIDGKPNPAWEREANGYACKLTDKLYGLEAGCTAQMISDVCAQFGVNCRVL